jgi:tetratricopeptide (TPR) repeat protein/predicted Ser/Thr protein kinase
VVDPPRADGLHDDPTDTQLGSIDLDDDLYDDDPNLEDLHDADATREDLRAAANSESETQSDLHAPKDQRSLESLVKAETLPLPAPEAAVEVQITQAHVAAPRTPGGGSGAHSLPSRLGGFELVRELGRGGMGVVYEARSDALDRRVALKVLLEGEFASGEVRERFQIEARAAARLRHPGLVGIHQIGEEGGHHFIVMDLIEGPSLAEALKDDGLYEPRPAAELVGFLAEAMAYAHERGVLHRDLKPANVLVAPDGRPVITDFGLAKVVHAPKAKATATGQVMGTPAYMSPEQATGVGVEARSDVYSLGAILYELLTGRPPFVGNTVYEVLGAVLTRDAQPPTQLRAGLDRDLETICLTCLEKDPEHRYASADALGADLANFQGALPIAARRPGPGDRVAKWVRRNPTLARVVGASVLALVTLAAGAYLWGVRARQFGAALAHREAITAAEERATERWEELSQVTTASTGQALDALQSAQAWHELDRDDARAREARFRAALTLGDVACASQQWELAASAYASARELGVDAARADRLVAEVNRQRTAETRRRESEVRGWLTRARLGELSEGSHDEREAILALARYRDARTRQLLRDEVQSVASQLHDVNHAYVLRAEKPTFTEARAGQPLLLGLDRALAELTGLPHCGPTLAPARAKLVARAEQRIVQRVGRRRTHEALPRLVDLLAAEQARMIPRGNLDAARVACTALGLMGNVDAAAAIARYVLNEADERRAVAATLALCQLADAAGVQAARRRLNLGRAKGPLRRNVLPALRAASIPPELESDTPEGYRRRARQRHDEGDSLGGLEDFERAIELDTQDPFGYAGRARLLLDLGKARDATRDVANALRLAPKNPEFLSLRARATWRTQPEQALADARQAVEFAPRSVPARQTLAEVLVSLGKSGEATQAFARALRIAPDDAALYLRRAQTLSTLAEAQSTRTRARELHQSALADLDRALELDPTLLEARLERGILRTGLLHTEGGLADLDEVIQRDRELPRAWHTRARLRTQLGNLRGALDDMQRVLDLSPRSAEALVDRALIHLARSDSARAVQDCDRALGFAPATLRALAIRAAAHKALGNEAKAQADLSAAAALDKSGDLEKLKAQINATGRRAPPSGRRLTPGELRGRSASRFRSGDVSGSLADLDRALDLRPRDSALRFERAELRLLSRHLGGARRDARAILAQNPEHAAARELLARIGMATGDWRGAIRALSRALASDPGAGHYYWERAGCHMKLVAQKGISPSARVLHLDAAHQDMQRAVELLPDDPDAWLAYGRVLQDIRATAQAADAYTRFLKLAPGHPSSAVVREWLGGIRARGQ